MDRHSLVSRLEARLRRDDRVRGLWLTGSMARGTDDDVSDVDLLAVLTEKDIPEFAANWPATARQLVPLVYVNKLDVGDAVVFNHIAEGWLRFDLLVGPAGALDGRSRRTVRQLFDRDGLGNELPAVNPDVPPSPERVARLASEFLRVLGLLPVTLRRADAVVAASGSTLLRTMLVELMVEAVEVEDRGGALHLSALLDAEHYRILRTLPPIEASRESAVAVHRACFDAFVPLGRQLCGRAGCDWPAEFESAVTRHLRATVPEWAEEAEPRRRLADRSLPMRRPGTRRHDARESRRVPGTRHRRQPTTSNWPIMPPAAWSMR